MQAPRVAQPTLAPTEKNESEGVALAYALLKGGVDIKTAKKVVEASGYGTDIKGTHPPELWVSEAHSTTIHTQGSNTHLTTPIKKCVRWDTA
ncbi:MAG: hypothetical protein AAB552_00955 [Patescibacteria group bacterium]